MLIMFTIVNRRLLKNCEAEFIYRVSSYDNRQIIDYYHYKVVIYT